jgi:hypothetical protein
MVPVAALGPLCHPSIWGPVRDGSGTGTRGQRRLARRPLSVTRLPLGEVRDEPGAGRANPLRVCDGDAVKVPGPLVAAVTSAAEDQLSLVLGAGCSMDAPTDLESAGSYARRCHDDLVLQGVIKDGCCDKSDLGALADAVFDAAKSQKPLVDILRPILANAQPNEGHKIAAALMAEHIVGLILTLNFDRAMSTAIAMIAPHANITIVHEVDDLGQKTRRGLIYLHGNVESTDDKWILRTTQIDGTWDGLWQEYVAHDFALTPNVVFAGLGSPTPVISTTVTKVRSVLPHPENVFQVDALPSAANKLAIALSIAPGAYVESCWTGFMKAISAYAVRKFFRNLADRHPRFCSDNGYAVNDLTLVLAAIPFDILKFGKLRASWFLDKSEYRTFRDTALDLMVDILRALALAINITGATACVPVEDGMDIRRDGRLLFKIFSVSGGGTMDWTAVEGKLRLRLGEFRRHDTTTPVVFLATGVDIVDPTVPATLVPAGDPDDITMTPPNEGFFTPRRLLDNPKLLLDMIKA